MTEVIYSLWQESLRLLTCETETSLNYNMGVGLHTPKFYNWHSKEVHMFWCLYSSMVVIVFHIEVHSNKLEYYWVNLSHFKRCCSFTEIYVMGNFSFFLIKMRILWRSTHALHSINSHSTWSTVDPFCMICCNFNIRKRLWLTGVLSLGCLASNLELHIFTMESRSGQFAAQPSKQWTHSLNKVVLIVVKS